MSSVTSDQISGGAAQERALAQHVWLRVVAQDTEVRTGDDGDEVLTESVRIPAEHLDAGPRGARFHVVDFDGTAGKLSPPVTIELGDEDPFADAAAASEAAREGNARFRARNVYAVAAATLATFEAALGRRLAWRAAGHKLFLVPRAFAEANAFYSPLDGAIYFGYVPGAEGEHLTCLSYDIVAHETSHAILDGLRPRYLERGLPDQAAFHEALGDCVAMLSVFAHETVVERLLPFSGQPGDRIPAEDLNEERLRQTALLGLAEGLGKAIGRNGPLRRSVAHKPTPDWRDRPDLVEEHSRGEVLVAAVMRSLLSIWTERLDPLIGSNGADPARVAEEGTKAATHLLGMLLRAIDYMPPVDLEFEDVLEAVLTADEVVAPDDRHGYRDAVREQFEAWGIEGPRPGIVDMTGRDQPRYERTNASVLGSDRDEALRFLWENADVFELDRTWRTSIEFLRPSVRIGPDGLLVSELLVGYVQDVELTAAQAGALGVEIPAGVDDELELRLSGGGVIVFDQFRRVKLHQRKPLEDWQRHSRRLAHLAGLGVLSAGADGAPARLAPWEEPIAELHRSVAEAGEGW